METPLACARCGRALGEGAPPAFATVMGGRTRALCAECVGDTDDVGALTALLDPGQADARHAGRALADPPPGGADQPAWG